MCATSSSEFYRRINCLLPGPPHKVQNITLENVKHDSVEVFWQPGSDGGEEQSFSVEYRKKVDVSVGERRGGGVDLIVEESFVDR